MTKRKPLTTGGKALLVIGIVLGSLILLAGLAIGAFYLFALSISDPVQVDPAYPVVFGVRADGDNLLISTGRECPKGTKFDITLPLTTVESPLSRYEYLTARQPVTVFDATDPEPLLKINYTYPETGAFVVQWKYTERIEISTDIPWSRDPFSSFLIFTNLQEESMNHPDQFYFGEMGWLTPDDVAARDGVDLLTICTPRPK